MKLRERLLSLERSEAIIRSNFRIHSHPYKQPRPEREFTEAGGARACARNAGRAKNADASTALAVFAGDRSDINRIGQSPTSEQARNTDERRRYLLVANFENRRVLLFFPFGFSLKTHYYCDNPSSNSNKTTFNISCNGQLKRQQIYQPSDITTSDHRCLHIIKNNQQANEYRRSVRLEATLLKQTYTDWLADCLTDVGKVKKTHAPAATSLRRTTNTTQHCIKQELACLAYLRNERAAAAATTARSNILMTWHFYSTNLLVSSILL
ncbi:FAD-dependent monooxygenase nvfK [Trichinella spiralis]|uniref:FAD-dependent monooxygenase nvfK n=1 Tax=Trichinella spiralis TaxID=6334 RepID=A0ABR3K894_TRISP